MPAIVKFCPRLKYEPNRANQLTGCPASLGPAWTRILLRSRYWRNFEPVDPVPDIGLHAHIEIAANKFIEDNDVLDLRGDSHWTLKKLAEHAS
ncbi:hypothetical protein MZK49_28345 [Ensifer sesbaniae]|jgi:hypothetical protein|uniref:hypothetical protein n=1 Tax=Ensifer sesbaniae TaxID=1214071 RepID=UPI0015684CB8|nr:hypothetical protein [Ensifer sesbaniae]MCK3780593.1 hypothetical protein [Ensifer sesbaniae]NRQ17531.1 hypothetical protein [Ensifer sesbaniae]